MNPIAPPMPASARDPLIDSRTAAWRLLVVLALMTLSGSAMYVVSVVIPAVQAEFGVSRAEASLPYTAMMLGFGVGGIFMGRWADRAGVHVPAFVGGVALCLGFVLAGVSDNIWTFSLAHGVLMGLLGSASTMAPLVADTSLWWDRYRGRAVAVCASGNYVAGSIWPGVAQYGVDQWGWRSTYVALGLFCGLGMAALSWRLRQRPPLQVTAAPGSAAALHSRTPFGLPIGQAHALLCVAGLACCVAMAMPQVHIVAYCTDLGFGAAQGAQMLSLMLFCGIISRLAFGVISDRIGGLRTLALGSLLQGVALLLFLPFDGLVPLYVISALFGLFQGGIVPSYAIIVREHFPPAEAGARVGAIIMATLLGMALGGWMSGKVFDLTGSYHAAFLNGIAFNLLNLSIALYLLMRSRRYQALRPA